MAEPIYGPFTSPPGGSSVVVSGPAPAFSGGQTRTYSNFDTTMFSNVWWAPNNIQAAMDGAINAPGETLTFSGISPDGLTATWIGQTTIQLYTGATHVVTTRFVAQIVGISGGATWVLPTDPDPDVVGPSALLHLDPGVNTFSVNLRFEASGPTSGGKLRRLPDLLRCDPDTARKCAGACLAVSRIRHGRSG